MKFEIVGGKKLYGSITVENSKNAILPIMASCVLIRGRVKILNVPEFSDIRYMAQILKDFGASVECKGRIMEIDCSNITKTELNREFTKKIRASVFLLGPMMARMGLCKMSTPGGCQIGTRPIDIHLSCFQELGAVVSETCDSIECSCDNYKGGRVTLRMASVGATENLIMFAATQKGKTTTLCGVAKEPEIVDLCNFLNKCGAHIVGAGTDTITIVGISDLHGTEYLPIGDRIIAGTYMLAVAICGGKLEICNANASHNKRLIDFLCGFGCEIHHFGDRIYISSGELTKKDAVISTGPYPEFATDLQSQTMTLLCITDGLHTITENMFEARLNHAQELALMGANIEINNNTATIHGKHNCLVGTTVKANDLRGCASLVLAGLAAKGTTTVENIEYVDRGYENFEQKLNWLGAEIHRIDDEKEKHNRN